MTFSWDKLYSLTFLWIPSFDCRVLRRSKILLNKVPNLPSDHDADYLFKQFSRYWDLETSRVNRGRPKLWLSLLRTFRNMVFILSGQTLIYLILYFLYVLSLTWLIRGLEDTQHYTGWDLVGIAVLFTVCSLSLNFCTQNLEYALSILGMKCRVLLTTAIFNKMQSMSYDQVQTISFGHIITLITSDLFKFDLIMSYVANIFLTPLCVLLIVTVQCLEIGWPAVLILPLFAIHLTITFILSAVDSRLYKKALKYSDIRNKHIREFIEGIKLVKCFAWEYAVAGIVKRIRRKEILMVFANFFFKSLGYTISLVFPVILIFATCLLVYISVVKGEMTSSRVFGLAAFMHWYYQIYKQFNTAIVGISELMVSLDRVQNFLQQLPRKIFGIHSENSSQTMLKVKNLSSVRNNGTNVPISVINKVTFSIQEGSIMSVIGCVGAGKTSLFLSLVNELEITGGEFHFPGSCVFVPQEPWIVSTTIRENIAYGREWDSQWYEQVVTACCLLFDFDQLPEGDLTVVGERGITLSGGQKARIGLARAVYANSDIYLLDDPLSSVDVAVVERLFQIFTHGLLSNKTVILATNQLQFVRRTDQILLLEKGKMVACGTYQELEARPLFRKYSKQIQSLHTPVEASSLETDITKGNGNRKAPGLSTSPRECNNALNEEVVHFASISILTYVKYFWAGSNLIGIACLAFFVLSSYFGVFVLFDYFLALWIIASQDNSTAGLTNATNAMISFNPLGTLNLDEQINIFVCFCILLSFLLFVGSSLETFLPVLSSFRLHTKMVWRVLRAPSTFFFTNSSGSIINRFSRDINIMDYLLRHFFQRFSLYTNILVWTMVSAAIAQWFTLIPSIILLAVLILYRSRLVRIIRQMKRMESAAKSDIILHTSLTLHGLTSIHSLELECHQFRKFCAYENIHSRCWRIYIGFIRWIALQANFLIAVYSLSIALILIYLREEISPAISAFAISQLFRLFDSSQFLLRVSAEVEMNMVSVERVFDYINLPQEAPLKNKSTIYNFILQGEIDFSRVQLRYSQDLPLVLKGVSFKVRGGEKLGIVGRTGAGKSSLQTALLRLVELDSGNITIDGININKFGLHELRGQISIIPQDPVLFSGPLRFALDPFSVFEDFYLWQVLEEVQLKKKVESLDGELNHSVSEGGSNFSVGERQLFCLARALLRQSKILILDEATSNVDTLTDNWIQHILRTKFQNCTILTIAHRLHTVIDYDRIMLMDNGRIVECDSPKKLLTNPNSKFTQLMTKLKSE